VKFNKICIIGLGYIGLPTASTFAMHGLDVIGVDINPHVIESLNRGKSHISNEPGLAEAFSKAVQAGKFQAALQPESADAYLIAVPTPFKENETGEFNGM
jgi:UDP-N-acetyl-D-mannosaminuronic acid dehydrogenase